jgi:thiamine pyrophosphate-dependent acetolactate synthase large subunit-like protein
MSKESDDHKPRLSRRAFLGTGAAAGAASMLPGAAVDAKAEAEASGAVQSASASAPSPQQMAREVGSAMPPSLVERAAQRPGSDLMVQVLRDLEIEFVVSNPGSSFEGLQESIVNYGEIPNVMPEFISALHEESAVDMAHGYARAEGKPVCALIQGTIGLQHASMAIYQAFLGRVPMIVLVGREDKHFLQQHTADDVAAIVRPFTKWDAHPHTIAETLDALQEAYRQAITPPCAPVVVIMDGHIGKEEAGDLQVPAYYPPTIATITRGQADAIASGLASAGNPRISVGRFRTPAGIGSAVELAELVGASVDSRATSGPMSFPQTHPLCGPGTHNEYDFELGLEVPGAQASVNGPHLRTLDDRDLVGINFGNIRPPVRPEPDTSGDMDLIADAEASLPLIIEATKKRLKGNAKNAVAARTSAHRKANHETRVAGLRKAVESKRAGWNGSPVSLARIYAELWPLIKDLDWCLASPSIFSGRHHVDLWDHDKPYSYLGVYPAAALGYGLGASTGAALAARGRDRIVINIQGDGDFNYAPGAVWTAAHHNLPILTIMHNNRAWHMELMYLQYMAGVRGRGTDRAHIGTTFRDPYINYAKLAEGYGVKSEGPISDPNELGAALARGVAAVSNGEPYLIDILTQPR